MYVCRLSVCLLSLLIYRFDAVYQINMARYNNFVLKKAILELLEKELLTWKKERNYGKIKKLSPN